MKKIFIWAFAWLSLPAFSQQLSFSSLDELLRYAENNSAVIRTGDHQSLLQKWQALAAKANTLNLRGTASFTATDNLNLPVNFIPAEMFGGAPGTFREITLGQQYVTVINYNPTIDIISPGAWARVQSANVSRELTEVTNQVNKKALNESIAACYFNILTLQSQRAALEKQTSAADSIFILVHNKYEAGLARLQDANNARANALSIRDALDQSGIRMEQQMSALHILCDIPFETGIAVSGKDTGGQEKISPRTGLLAQQARLQFEFQQSELRASRFSYWPVFSLTGSLNWQNNSNERFLDPDANWISSQFIGLRVSVPIPPDILRWSQEKTALTNMRMAAENLSHVQLQEQGTAVQMKLDHENAKGRWETAVNIARLKRDNYLLYLKNYEAGILSLDTLLTSFLDMTNAELSEISGRYQMMYQYSRIQINNNAQ